MGKPTTSTPSTSKPKFASKNGESKGKFDKSAQKSRKRHEPDASKKSLVDQKLAKKQRKMQKPHYETVTRAKEIWNVARERDIDPAKRRKLIDELFTIVQGKMNEVAARHDASRVIQALIKFGTKEQRSAVVEEMKEHIVEMCKTQYGSFLVQKMLRYGSNADRAVLVKQFTGHVVELGTHNIAAHVLETAQEHLKPSQLSGLKLEFFGKEFAYFKQENKKNLTDLLAANPTKKQEILKNLGTVLTRMTNKQLLDLAFVQSLMWDYFANAPHEDVAQMASSVQEASLALLSTRKGARVVVSCISIGSPKDRKRIIKCLKDKMLEACNHPSGYLVIMRLLDVVDDTVQVQKSVLAELNDHLFDIAMHPTGRKVLLHLLSPMNTKYLSPDDVSLLQPPMVPSPEDPEVKVVNYKKEPEVRRQELLQSLLPKLEDMCMENMDALLRSKEGRDVVAEVFKQSESDELPKQLIELVTSEPMAVEEGDEEQEVEPLYQDAVAHFALRRLIKETVVAEALLDAVVDDLAEWSQNNRSAFVVLAFLEAEHGSSNAKKVIAKALKKDKKKLKKLSESQTGTRLVLEKLEA